MELKYIVIRAKIDEGLYQDFPIIFPHDLVHAEVAKLIQSSSNFNTFSTDVLSAGEIKLVDVKCSGKSTSLDINSRFEEDDRLILSHRINHGLVFENDK